jgi:hypothetical protein
MCQQTTNRKLGSGCQMKIFSPLGGLSVAITSIFGKLLENGERYAKHVK